MSSTSPRGSRSRRKAGPADTGIPPQLGVGWPLDGATFGTAKGAPNYADPIPGAPGVTYTPERRRLADLVPNKRNTRTHPPEQVEQLRRAIREFGWTTPVLIDETDVILAGHGRREAGLAEGIDEVPVVVARGLDEAQKRALVIADNQIAANAGWDRHALRLELAELRSLDLDLTLLGFNPEELGRLSFEATAPGEFKAFDENVATEHQCPKCGYRWSGGSAAPADGDDGE